MSRREPCVEERAFMYKTLTPKESQMVTNFLIRNNPEFVEITQEHRTRLFALARCILIPALNNQWSYGLMADGQLVAVSIQLDLLDYLKMVNTIGDHPNFADFIDLSNFEPYLRELKVKAKRGDCILNLVNMVSLDNQPDLLQKQEKFLYQNLSMCRMCGWRNVIFSTEDAVPLLRINAEVVGESNRNPQKDKLYLMRVRLGEMSFSLSPFNKLQPSL